MTDTATTPIKPLPAVVLILSDARGRYIPRDFVQDKYAPNAYSEKHCRAWHITPADAIALLDPDGEHYWDVWDEVMQYAYYEDTDGAVYTLHQDGDLWGICFDKMTADELRNFGFEAVEVDDDTRSYGPRV